MALVRGRASWEAMTSGIPCNVRLRRIVRSRRVRDERTRAEAQLREQIAGIETAMPSARLLCVRLVDRAHRPARYEPRIDNVPPGPRSPALTCALYVEAYFGTDMDPERLADELISGTPGSGRRRGASWVREPGGRWDCERPGQPLTLRLAPRPLDRAHFRREARTDPADWSLDDARTRHGTLLRWSTSTTYATVPRYPWLRRLRRSSP